ncbi:MAG: methionyl-tRNA formyltransferase [bacterium]
MTTRILFAGTPDFSVPPLKALLKAGYEVAAVYTQPDRPAGRGRKVGISPVKEAAIAAGLPVEQPVNFKSEEAIQVLKDYQADIMVVVAYGLLLPKAVLEAPRLGCVNIHASILPRWRGAAPIQRAIAAGDSESGISIMQMDEGLDTGPVYHLHTVPITDEDTGGSLHDKLADAGAEALLTALPGILDGSLAAEPQSDDAAVYASKLTKREAQIDWHKSAESIASLVRAFNPWPVAYTPFEQANLRIWEAHPVQGVAGDPGMVMAAGREGVDVSTGDGLLRVTSLQMPGKRRVDAADFINAYEIQGMMLG